MFEVELSAFGDFSMDGLCAAILEKHKNTIKTKKPRVAIGTAGRLVGHIFIHQADDSGFVCERD
jgi:hypothetical protein